MLTRDVRLLLRDTCDQLPLTLNWKPNFPPHVLVGQRRRAQRPAAGRAVAVGLGVVPLSVLLLVFALVLVLVLVFVLVLLFLLLVLVVVVVVVVPVLAAVFGGQGRGLLREGRHGRGGHGQHRLFD